MHTKNNLNSKSFVLKYNYNSQYLIKLTYHQLTEIQKTMSYVYH